jgi:hypothetical protein
VARIDGAGAEAAACNLSFTLAPPNKVTPVRGFPLFLLYYVKYRRKRLADGLIRAIVLVFFGYFGLCREFRRDCRTLALNHRIDFTVNVRSFVAVN